MAVATAAPAIGYGAVPTLRYASGLPYPRLAPWSLGLVAAAHAVLLLVLLNQRPAAPMPVEPPILVSLVQAEPVATKAPQPTTPQRVVRPAPPKPVVQQPKPQGPETAAKLEPRLVAESPATTPAPVETAAPAAPLVEDAPSTQAEAPRPAEAAPQEEVLEPPRFNADYLDNPAPGYPPLARRLREQGRVLLRVQVNAAGVPAQVLLQQSSGHARLDEVASATVRRWKFVPARQGGRPVDAWVIVPIQFSLKG